MKKFFSLLIVSLMAICLCACGGETKCEHQAWEDDVANGSYERTTATCTQGGIEYYNCKKCGTQGRGTVEIPVEPYGHIYESETQEQNNFKCIWCDETQISLNATLPKEVTTNYRHGPLASKINIKNVELATDIEVDCVTLRFDVEATQISEPNAVYKYLICFVVKDHEGNVVWDGEAKAVDHQYGERELAAGDEFTALDTRRTSDFNVFESNVKYTWTIEIVDTVIIEYSTGYRVEANE